MKKSEAIEKISKILRVDFNRLSISKSGVIVISYACLHHNKNFRFIFNLDKNGEHFLYQAESDFLFAQYGEDAKITHKQGYIAYLAKEFYRLHNLKGSIKKIERILNETN